MSRATKKTARTPLFILSATALILSLVPLSAFSAQKITAGAPCTKLNSKATANKKTYTCIKKNGKLVWNSGTTIKTASAATKSTPSPTPEASPTSTIDLLSQDPRITEAALLSAASLCKTIDKTPEMYSFGGLSRNGFPRPVNALYPSGKAKILVIPFQYKTWPFTTEVPQGAKSSLSDLDLLRTTNREVENLFKELSRGQLDVDITILPKDEWWTMDPDLTFDSTPFRDNFGPVKEMIKKNDGKIDFEKYDSYVFVSSIFAPQLPIGTAQFITDVKTSKGQANKLVLMTYRWTSPNIYFHELGHSMFAFEDLYIQSDGAAPWLPKDLSIILRWEIMANAEISSITNWNRLLMGWIKDSEIRCVTDQKSSTHYLSDFALEDKPKLLLVNLEPGITLAAETRKWRETQRLLLYIIDTNLNHGEGPLRSYDTLLTTGDSKEIYDWKFKVLETNEDGLIVEVSKGSGNKYVTPNRGSNNPVGGGDRPRPRSGEILPTTYLNARVKWEISNYKSYRIFITPFDEPNRILFDTGIVNDSQDPLIVEVSGLICGKEFMTTSQFWTERDGKGVKEQSSSGQLRKFECKS